MSSIRKGWVKNKSDEFPCRRYTSWSMIFGSKLPRKIGMNGGYGECEVTSAGMFADIQGGNQ